MQTRDDWPSNRWPNFSFDEMACRETGECDLNEDTMDRLQELRTEYGRGLIITSGYRSPKHSVEAKKKDPEGNPRPGAHSTGRAVDIAIRGEDAYVVLALATSLGFLHLDDIQDGDNFHAPRPFLWSY